MVLVMTFGDATLVLLIEFATSLFIPQNVLRVDGCITASRILAPSPTLESESSNLTAALCTWSMTDDRQQVELGGPHSPNGGMFWEGLEIII